MVQPVVASVRGGRSEGGVVAGRDRARADEHRASERCQGSVFAQVSAAPSSHGRISVIQGSRSYDSGSQAARGDLGQGAGSAATAELILTPNAVAQGPPGPIGRAVGRPGSGVRAMAATGRIRSGRGMGAGARVDRGPPGPLARPARGLARAGAGCSSHLFRPGAAILSRCAARRAAADMRK